MSFHDKIALQALLDGNTSAQFRDSAQRHADATWIFLIIAGIVWYFSSWAWALIPFVVAAWMAVKSVSATAIAIRLEKYESK